MKTQISIHWFRRDLRLDDNPSLDFLSNTNFPILPIFIFDENIIDTIEPDDSRITFIYRLLANIDKALGKKGSSIQVFKGNVLAIFKELNDQYDVKQVSFNRDYEPSATERDNQIIDFLKGQNIEVNTHQDHVIFEPGEILKDDGKPYTIFTPYWKKWQIKFQDVKLRSYHQAENFIKKNNPMPSLKSLGFQESTIIPKDINFSLLDSYKELRDFPAQDATTKVSPHLRFGSISTRRIIKENGLKNTDYISELVWREFFIQILFHFPLSVSNNFKSKYDFINWRNNEDEFEKWCKGQTGYPLVDAGMRELNETGIMHNRVRMVVASFLCKHLIIDWRWGEAYFASKLLDFELASNVGNWQWSAGTGCDAAPYFRIFNPTSQMKKFDSKAEYVRKWVPEFDGFGYTDPIVEHRFARERALAAYKKGLESNAYSN